MVKEKRILSYFVGWLIIGFCILFVGVNNVFAASYDYNNFTAQIYDNTGGLLEAKTTTKGTDGDDFYYSFGVNYNAYSSGGAWGISSPIPLIAKHTYSMTVDPTVIGCGFTVLSTYNRIGVGTTLANTKSSYESATNVNLKFSQAVSNSRYLQFVFTPTINASYIIFPFSTTLSCTSAESHLSTIVIEDLGESGVSQDEINNSLNNQTNELNESIQNSTDTITGEIDDMEQAIIDSNKETQEVIKDQFNDCRDSVNLLNPNGVSSYSSGINFTNNGDGSFTISGTATANKSFPLTTLLPTLEKNKNYTLSLYILDNDGSNYSIPVSVIVNDGSIQYNYFSLNANKLSQTKYTNEDLSINSISVYISNGTTVNSTFKVQLQEGSVSTNYELYGEEICTNKIDETNDKLDGIQDALTDSSSPDTSGLANSAGWLPAGPLDSILNLPLTMLNSLTNSLGKTCNPLNLTLPYVNKNIQIPCLSAIFAQITGVDGLWTWVGTIASVLILYNYLLNLYAWVDRVLTLRAEFDEAMGADLANWGRL